MASYKADVTYEDQADLDGFLDKVKEEWGLESRVVEPNGPAGGAAVVEFTGPRKALDKFGEAYDAGLVE